MKKCFSFLIVLSMSLLMTSCTSDELTASVSQEASTSLFAMDTYISLTAYGDEAKAALAASETKIRELEGMWSVTDKESEIYALNHNNGSTTKLSKDTAAIISFALEMADKTEGALVVTIYPVLTAWGFTTGNYQIPTEAELSVLLERIGYKKVLLDNGNITMPEGFQIDLGALGKGYAADIITDILEGYGINSALIDLGGNIQAIGFKPDGSRWRLGIKDPHGNGNLGVLEVADRAVVTSGGYERYFIGEDGNQYWHIIDPSNGQPAHSGLVSVCLVGAEGKICEAFSTAFSVMGLEKAISYWQENDSFDMILATEENELYITEGLENDFTLSENYETMKVNVVRNKSTLYK